MSEIGSLHDSYEAETDLINFGENGSETARAGLSDGIMQRINELIRLRDQEASNKTAMASDNAASAAEVILWLTIFGIAGAFVMACARARNQSTSQGTGAGDAPDRPG